LHSKMITVLAALALLPVLAAGCGGSDSAASAAGTGKSSSTPHGGKINLVAYSTPQPAYEELIPAFQKTAAGQDTSFTQSYGASGDQSRAVAAGQPADVVHFALEPDIKRLVDASMVDSSWQQDVPNNGIVAETEVVFAVRKGNPKNITTWDDLVKPGVEVITPNPFTSGGARWNIMAAYGAELKEGKSPEEAEKYLDALFHNVPVQDDKASASLQTFTGGKGDVLLAYEQDALLAQNAGEDIQIVYPPQTISIQTPIAWTSNSQNPDVAKAFVEWMFTKPAQEILAKNGYRSVLPEVASEFTSTYPQPRVLFTIDDVGGWDEVMTTFFDPENSVMQKIEQSLGVSTGD
jgi:sulfate/thiosulfate transport system substrate-binding protein